MNSILRLSVLVGSAIVLLAAPKPASAVQSDAETAEAWALELIRPNYHGLPDVSIDLREAVANDQRVLSLYSDLLSGSADIDFHPWNWDLGLVLWWLAESGAVRYLHHFITYSDPDKVLPRNDLGNARATAIYGLLRLIEEPRARKQFAVAARSDDLRPVARSVLRNLAGDNAAEAVLQIVDEGRTPGPGDFGVDLSESRWPCPTEKHMREAGLNSWFGCEVP